MKDKRKRNTEREKRKRDSMKKTKRRKERERGRVLRGEVLEVGRIYLENKRGVILNTCHFD